MSSTNESQRMDGRLPLYSEEQVLHQTPSRKDGISYEEEKHIRKKAVVFITKAGEALKAPIAAIGTASIYLHHFYMHFSFRAFKYWEISAAALFLALKLEDLKQDILTLAKTCWDLYHRNGSDVDIHSHTLKEFRTKLLDDELLLLQTVEFRLRPRLPYVSCLTLFNQLCKEDPKPTRELLAQYSWWFVHSSLQSTLCLTTSPLHLAMACVQAAAEVPEVDLARLGSGEWWAQFDGEFTREQYERIADQFIEMVEGDLKAKISK